MKRGRPVQGAKAVEALEGSEEAKRKLKAVLQAVTGEREIEEISRELGIGKTAFYELRAKLLGAALQEGEPKPPGRPAKHMTAEEKEIEWLRAENARLRLDLEVAYVREEIMLAMPELFEPLKKKRRREKRGIIEYDGKARPTEGAKPGGAAPDGAGADHGGKDQKK
jgi:transposase-like protein